MGEVTVRTGVIIRPENKGAYLGYLNLARDQGHAVGRGSKQLSATTAQSDKQFTKFF